MRRALMAMLVAALAALPSQAQMRSSRTAAGFRGTFAPVRPAPGSIRARGGFVFGGNPRVHVFIRPRPFFRHRVFFRPFFSSPVLLWPSSAYYGGFPYSADDSTVARADYEQGRLIAEVDSLRQEVARLRAEEDVRTYLSARERERQESRQARPAPTPVPEATGPATAFVLLNGEQIDAQNYAIVGPTLWILSEQRARKIPLSDLDLDKTTRLNEERGIELRLPVSSQPKRPK